MFPMAHAWGKTFLKLFLGASFVATVSAVAQETNSSEVVSLKVDSLAVDTAAAVDTATVVDTTLVDTAVVDSSVAVPDSVSTPDAVISPSDSMSVKSDLLTAKIDSVPAKQTLVPEKKKSVLYLGGGENSPWYHLGVLYAIESYSIPVDSVVGTSWGAFIGALWAKGVSLDDIQRILLDSYLEPYAGHDLWAAKETSSETQSSGQKSLRVSSSPEFPTLEWSASKSTSPTLYKLRLQESLYRQSYSYKIPFAVLGCDGVVGNSIKDVIASLPLEGHQNSGEYCPYLALPAAVSTEVTAVSAEVATLPAEEFSIISVADPVRSNPSNFPWKESIRATALQNLQKLDAPSSVVIRSHSLRDTTHNDWIQAGFTAVERRLTSLSDLRKKPRDYASTKTSMPPWFKFNPVFDSLPAQASSSIQAYWNDADTGMVAPSNFEKKLLQQPTYDSVTFDMLPSGNLQVNVAVHPALDFEVGGFGSNAIGPNVYGRASLSFVDHMEWKLSVAGFWGNETYGIMPRLNIAKFWQKDLSFAFGYDWLHLTPLKAFGNDTPDYGRIFAEKRNDLQMQVAYQISNLQAISLNFLFGERTFELSSDYYRDDSFDTYPVYPHLRYEVVAGDKDRWFSQDGFSVVGDVGLQSIGYGDGPLGMVIPIHWKVLGEARFSHSPSRYFSWTAAAAGGVDFFHDEGHGYVYPESFGMDVVDNCYRQRIIATPWSTEWYNAELASHGYAMGRFNMGFHYKGNGLWIFTAYLHDFEENPLSVLDKDRVVLEPAFRLVYKSLSAYFGISRVVDFHTFDDLSAVKDYSYFVRIGNYEF